MVRSHRLATVLVALFLALQVAIPTLVLIDRSEGATHRFGWQMFSENPDLAELEFETASGERTPIQLQNYVRKIRIDVDYAGAGKDFCRLIPEAVAIFADGNRIDC